MDKIIEKAKLWWEDATKTERKRAVFFAAFTLVILIALLQSCVQGG